MAEVDVARELIRVVHAIAPKEMCGVTFETVLGDGSIQCEWHREDLILEAIVTAEGIETFSWGPFETRVREATVATPEEAAAIMVEAWTNEKPPAPQGRERVQ